MIIGSIIILTIVLWLTVKYQDQLLNLFSVCVAFLLGWIFGYFISAALSAIGLIGANWSDAYVVNLATGFLAALGIYRDMKEYPEGD